MRLHNPQITGSLTVSGSSGVDFTSATKGVSGSFRASDIKSALPANTVSSSAQLAVRISGSFTSLSSSLASRLTSEESDFTSAGISGSFTDASSSFSTRVTRNEATGSSLTSASSSFSTRVSNLKSDSGSFSARITAATSSISALKTDSGSFSTRLDNSEASGALMNQDLKTSASPTFVNVTATGTMTAQEFHTEFVSASIVYRSGSTKFGDTIDDIHSFTGSINQSGSFNLNDGNMSVTDTLTATTLTGTTIKDFSTISGSSTSTGSFGSLYSGKDILVGGAGNIGTATTSHIIKMGTTNRHWGMKATTSPDELAVGEMNTGALFFDSAGDIRIGRHISGSSVSTGSFGSVHTAGKVGIGTTAPDGKLHVMGASAGSITANANADEAVFEGGGDTGISILSPDGNWGALFFGSPSNNVNAAISGDYNSNSEIMRFWVGDQSAAKMTLNNSGNLGIGTTAPGAKLHVHSATAISRTYSPTAEPTDDVKFMTATGSDGTGVGLYQSLELSVGTGASSVGWLNYVRGGDNQGRFTFVQRKASSTYAEQMVISSSGYVGIGTTDPTQMLEIAGDVRIKDARSLFFKRHGDNYAWRIRNESASDGSTYGFNSSNDLVFEVVGASHTNADPSDSSHTLYASSANTLVLQEAGQVGIKVADPQYTLDVGGTLNKGVPVTTVVS